MNHGNKTNQNNGSAVSRTSEDVQPSQPPSPRKRNGGGGVAAAVVLIALTLAGAGAYAFHKRKQGTTRATFMAELGAANKEATLRRASTRRPTGSNASSAIPSTTELAAISDRYVAHSAASDNSPIC